MNNRIVIIALSVIIVIQMAAGIFILKKDSVRGPLIPPFGFMEGGPGMEHGRRHMMGNRFGGPFCDPEFMEKKLALKPDQIEKITGLNKKFDTEFAGYIRLIEPEREKLKEMLDSNTEDMEAVRNQLKKIENLNVEIHLLRIKQGKEISAILTPEQMKQLHEERKNLFNSMRRNHGGLK